MMTGDRRWSRVHGRSCVAEKCKTAFSTSPSPIFVQYFCAQLRAHGRTAVAHFKLEGRETREMWHNSNCKSMLHHDGYLTAVADLFLPCQTFFWHVPKTNRTDGRMGGGGIWMLTRVCFVFT